MSLYSIEAGATLFEQNQNGNYFYIVKLGELALLINNVPKKTLKVGDSFGELALLQGSVRSATIKATTAVKVWCMERKNFRKIMDHIINLNHLENKKYIASIPILSNL